MWVSQTSNQSISVTNTSGSTAEGANLVGNPFTSTIAANSAAQITNNFLNKNSSVLAGTNIAVYLWDEGINDYATINNLSTATFIAPGQGFMVVAKTTGNSTLNFHEVIQKHGTTSFYKAGKEDVSRFEIMVTNPENALNKTMICFLPEMTNGLDHAYDARKLKGNLSLALYTKLVEDDGGDYAIQCLSPIMDGVSVKLGLRAEVTGTYVFEPSRIENIAEDIPINLMDKTTGIITDLRKNPSYTCEVLDTGIDNDRFVLHFKDAVGIEEVNQTGAIHFYVHNQQLLIVDDDIGSGTVSLYNMMGQCVLSKIISDQSTTIQLDLPTGYYVVNIKTDFSLLNEKVFVR